MDIQNLAAWGEFIGGIAGVIGATGVIGSLIFVGFQIRTQNKEAKLAAIHEMSKDYRSVSDNLYQDPKITEIFLSVSRDGFDNLDDVSAMRAQLIYQSLLRFWQDAHFQYTKGSLDSDLWGSIERGLSSAVSTEGFKQYWHSRGSWYSEDFARYLETQMNAKPFSSVRDEISQKGTH